MRDAKRGVRDAERGVREPIYVVAIVDPPIGEVTIADRLYTGISVASLYAVVEARDAAPPTNDDELRHQFRVVVELAEAADAVLPLRFGSQMSREELTQLLIEHHGPLREALDAVRGCVQMNVRFTGSRRDDDVSTPVSGRAYLQRRAASVRGQLTPPASRLLTRLDALAVQARLAPGAGGLLATAYHLVERATLTKYQKAAARAASVGAIVTGPHPPFAFTPGVLR